MDPHGISVPSNLHDCDCFKLAYAGPGGGFFIRATSINILPQEALVGLRPWQDKSQAARETAHKD